MTLEWVNFETTQQYSLLLKSLLWQLINEQLHNATVDRIVHHH